MVIFFHEDNETYRFSFKIALFFKQFIVLIKPAKHLQFRAEILVRLLSRQTKFCIGKSSRFLVCNIRLLIDTGSHASLLRPSITETHFSSVIEPYVSTV